MAHSVFQKPWVRARAAPMASSTRKDMAPEAVLATRQLDQRRPPLAV